MDSGSVVNRILDTIVLIAIMGRIVTPSVMYSLLEGGEVWHFIDSNYVSVPVRVPG